MVDDLQASASKAVQASQMHARSRSITEKIQEAHTESNVLQSELEAAERSLTEASERLKAARFSYENLQELLVVAENARVISAAVSRAYGATCKAALDAQEAEDTTACKQQELRKMLAQNRLLEGSGTAVEQNEATTAGVALIPQIDTLQSTAQTVYKSMAQSFRDTASRAD
jgi:hypothetical protein